METDVSRPLLQRKCFWEIWPLYCIFLPYFRLSGEVSQLFLFNFIFHSIKFEEVGCFENSVSYHTWLIYFIQWLRTHGMNVTYKWFVKFHFRLFFFFKRTSKQFYSFIGGCAHSVISAMIACMAGFVHSPEYAIGHTVRCFLTCHGWYTDGLRN